MANSVSIKNLFPFDSQKGVSIKNNNNLFIEITDALNNPIIGVLTITGGSSIDGVYSGESNYLFETDEDSNILFTATQLGYTPDAVLIDLIQTGLRTFTLVLTTTKVLFTCTTTFKNGEGVTVSKPLSTGYIEVVFTGNLSFNLVDYLPTFEAIPLGGSKYSGQVLGYSLLSSSASSVTYRVDVVKESGDFCYLSNFIKKQC